MTLASPRPGTAQTGQVRNGPNTLKLGVFGFNFSGGGTPSLAEGVLRELNWDQQVRIAQAGERAGLEALIPGARWRGFRGPNNHNGSTYESVVWAAGISAVTSDIDVFATIHVPLTHPIRAAKEIATVDHISGGRFGLNVVAGWQADELAMFDVPMREHDERYRVAAEWVDLLKAVWAADEDFDFSGEYYKAVGAFSEPKPLQKPWPVIMSAGASPAGRAFAASRADVCFVVGGDALAIRELIAKTRRTAYEDGGRTIKAWTTAGIVCAESEKEARRYYDYFVHEKGDWEAAENMLKLLVPNAASMDFTTSRAMQERMIAMSAATMFIGTPEQIVDRMGQFAEAGVDGLAVTWVDFEQGIAQYDDTIRPLAIKAGLRIS